MKNENTKSILVSIAIGATVSFFSVFFQGLADLLKSHSVEIASGLSASGVYLAKAYKG